VLDSGDYAGAVRASGQMAGRPPRAHDCRQSFAPATPSRSGRGGCTRLSVRYR
jgi:hypothetical protein